MPRPTPLSFSLFSLLVGLAVAAAGEPTRRAHALRSPVPPPAATLFAKVPAEVTGLTEANAFDDPNMWSSRYREFTLGAIGTGVGIRDMDTDGRPDLVVVMKTGGLRYYRNEGNWRFSDQTAAAGLALPTKGWYQGVALADVDNDGRADVYVSRFAQPNQLFMNLGNGRFREEADTRGVALVDASSQAFFIDYDRDGWLDLYLQTNLLSAESGPNGQADRLYRNMGQGRFTEVTEASGIKGETQGHSATWWDYDEDGWPDLYVANDFRDPDSLWRNRGDGTFTQELSRVVPLTPHSSMGADVGDLNNDGHLDLIVADMAATTHVKDHRGMARVRAGLPDTDATPQNAPQYMRNAVFLNTGAGRMEEIAWMTGLEATDWTWTVRLEDFDEDGWIDAYFTNGMVRELHNADIVKKMGAFESLTDRIRIMQDSPELQENNLAFRNGGDLRFENVSKKWGLDELGISFGAASGDLDGDGDLDLVVANHQAPLSVYRNDSQGRSLTLSLEGSTSSRDAFGAEVRLTTPQGTQTRVLLPTRGYLSSHEPLLHFGLGKTTVPAEIEIRWPSGRRQTLSGVSAGQHLTLREPEETFTAAPHSLPAPWLEPIPESLGLQVLVRGRVVNEHSRQPLLTQRQNRIGPSLTATDLDGDGSEDLLIGGASGEPLKQLSILGQAYLALGLKGVEAMPDLADAANVAFDANGDGATDLLLTKGGNAPETARSSYQPRLVFNDGRGNFSAAAGDAWPQGKLVVGAAAVADFDRDGDLDIFLGARPNPGTYPKSGPTRLYRNEGGRFLALPIETLPNEGTLGPVASAVWTDLNLDGWPDLVVAAEWGPVRAWLNEKGNLREATQELGLAAAGSGLWTSLATADCNGDGRPDIVAGNLGYNTPRQARPQQPVLLWPRVAEPGGRPQMLETIWSQNRLYPLRGYSHLAAAFPTLARRYPNFDVFAAATLDELIPTTWRGEEAPLQADQLAQGVFLSQADGAYRFQPFSRDAQIAPVYGWQAADLDGDGHLDLLGVGNSFAPIPEIGRAAGGVGLVLQGDGKGSFRKVSPTVSGWLIPGDAKGFVTIDTGKGSSPLFLISRHHDRTTAWAPSERSAHAWIKVRLQGQAGNPTAIGARVEVEFTNGSRQTSEVQAGHGHLSQNSPTLFFGHARGVTPTKVRVTWPLAGTVEYAWPEPAISTLTLSSP